ncbi:hypothetical protein [Streptomyces sp. NBRC 110611]|uniref:hypothetical protein n=1 Tax=Streptomyces sp. NBRC 110611 TaxID=1621259 RepID=UPI0015EE5A75|nr:hypothetical protein [Streptomyces sp. NBRC 110611]
MPTSSSALPNDEQQAILGQLARQRRIAAEITEWAQHNAHWRHLPNGVFNSLETAKTAT